MAMRLAISTLCEDPARPTGLTSLFRELVSNARREFTKIEWDVFLPRDTQWEASDGVCPIRIDVQSSSLPARLFADHFQVGMLARKRACRALITVGFLPAISPVPNVAHVNTLHHMDPANRTGSIRALYRGWEVSRILRSARLVITNSNVAAEVLTGIHPGVRERLLVSPEGVQHEVFHPNQPANETDRLADRFSLRPGYILWVSNFYPYKQLDRFLEAYARLSRTEREEHPAVLVGGDWQGTRRWAKHLAESLGISSNVRFLGWVPDEWIAPLYRCAALHVLASRSETFGRSVLEAMACGTLCAVNDIPIMREVTQGHAIFTDMRDKESTAAALRAGLLHTPSNDALRKEAVARASEFSMRRLARERVEAIEQRLG